MISYQFSFTHPVRNLPKLLEAYHSDGGSIVEYERVVSFLVVSSRTSHYVWVPSDASRVARSLPNTLITLVAGWWSIRGFLWTLQALSNNLRGGYDVTDDILNATHGGDVHQAKVAIDTEVNHERKKSIYAILQFLAILAVIGIFVLLMNLF
jgi:hypothetical protein